MCVCMCVILAAKVCSEIMLVSHDQCLMVSQPVLRVEIDSCDKTCFLLKTDQVLTYKTSAQ